MSLTEHNHTDKVLKPYGECPKCDLFRVMVDAVEAEGRAKQKMVFGSGGQIREPLMCGICFYDSWLHSLAIETTCGVHKRMMEEHDDEYRQGH